MKVIRHRQFRKNYQKRILPFANLDKKFEQRLGQFLQNSSNPELKDHKLLGPHEGFRSFSITGDIRVIYRKFNSTVELYDIGSHNQVS